MDTKIDQLKQIIPEKYILKNEPMKKHTTFRIGGHADIFAAPESIEEIEAVCRFAKEQDIPLFVLGNGSNLCFHNFSILSVLIVLFLNL